MGYFVRAEGKSLLSPLFGERVRVADNHEVEERELMCTNNHVADRVLLRYEPLKWESRVQDKGPEETTQPHIISIKERSPRNLCINTKTQLHPTARKLQCWTPHAK